MRSIWHRMGHVIALLTLSACAAQANELNETVAFDIPAQPLESALLELSKQSSLQIVFSSGALSDHATPHVLGRMPVRDALNLLLRDTALGYKLVGERTLTVTSSAVKPIAEQTATRSPAQPIRLAQAEAARVIGPRSDDSGAVPELEEVVVTAERVQRSLRQTATSVVVFDSKALENRAGLDSVEDVLSRIPNVTDSGVGNLLPAVRGIDGTGPASGRDAFFGGTRGRFAFQVDGRPLSYNESVFGSTAVWDVQQVEMLRGPQSSLQGRNSIGGVVAIRSRDPSYEWQSGIKLEGGSDSAQQTAAYVSGPLLDRQLAFRLAVDRKTADAWLPYVPYDTTYEDNPVDTTLWGNPYYDAPLTLMGDEREWIRNPGAIESETYRAKLLFQPESLPDFSALLTLNRAEYAGSQGDWAFAREDFERFGATPGHFRGSNGFVEAYPVANVFSVEADSAILGTSFKYSEAVTFETTLSQANVTARRIGPVGYGNLTLEASEVMFEPRVLFGTSGRGLSGIVGVYYFHNQQDETIDSAGGGSFDDETTTVAGFAELTYALTQGLDVTLGGRFEREKRDRLGGAGPFVTDFDATYEEFMPKAVLTWRMGENWTVGAAANRGYNGGGTAFTFSSPLVNYSYEPEYVWNYELFTRGSLLGNRLELTANVFVTDYEDFQLPYDLNPSPEYSIVIVNAEKVQTSGIELGLRALIAKDVEVSLDTGFLDTKVKEFTGGQQFPGGYVLPPSEFQGNELPRSPDFTAQLTLSYRPETGFYAVADTRYSGAYYSSIVNREDERVASYWTANAQIGYAFRNMRLYLSVTNLFDEKDTLFIERSDYDFDFDGTLELTSVPALLVQPPRAFAVGVQIDL
jgi:iron complex outermembrane recepter protein